MAVASTTVIATITAAAAIASTAVSMAAQQRQAQQQKDAAEYQAKIAEQNQQLEQEQAAANRREGYDKAGRKRLEVANIIGKQRAQAAGSGAAVDQGSFLDLNLDTAEKGEMDALALQQQGLDAARGNAIQAWNAGQKASAAHWEADRVDPTLAMTGTALGGIARVGSTFGSGLWGKGSATAPANSSLAKQGKQLFSATVAPVLRK